MIGDVCQAVVDTLNGAQASTSPFSMSFTAERRTIVEVKQQDLEALQVVVVPRALSSKPFTRADDEKTYSVDIGIRKKVANLSVATVDDMLQLVQDISDYLSRNHLGSYKWTRTECPLVYDHEELRQKSVFISILTVTYQVT